MSSAISKLASLNHFRIDLSSIDNEKSVITYLANSLVHLKSLTFLSLNLYSDTRIGDAELSILAYSIGSLLELKYLNLNLSYTGTDFNGIKILGSALKKL